jgi:hypothetical protein
MGTSLKRLRVKKRWVFVVVFVIFALVALVVVLNCDTLLHECSANAVAMYFLKPGPWSGLTCDGPSPVKLECLGPAHWAREDEQLCARMDLGPGGDGTFLDMVGVGPGQTCASVTVQWPDPNAPPATIKTHVEERHPRGTRGKQSVQKGDNWRTIRWVSFLAQKVVQAPKGSMVVDCGMYNVTRSAPNYNPTLTNPERPSLLLIPNPM